MQIYINKSEPKSAIEDLLSFGGFPEPFLKQDVRLVKRWQRLRSEQLFREDLRDLTELRTLDRVELLANLLKYQAGQLTNFSTLANKVQASSHSIREWLTVLSRFYYCFTVKPWHKNIPRSLLKEPKVYLWDWSTLQDIGARAENFIASHLHKATQFWTDRGFGQFDMFFIRDKEKREVDFLVTKDDTPWFLVEVKNSHKQKLSEDLARFQHLTGAKHAFQVALNAPFIDKDCFQETKPIIVPAATFLSQLI